MYCTSAVQPGGDLSKCGDLEIGSYTLRAETNGNAYSFFFANQFIDSGTSAAFDLALHLDAQPLPALPGTGRGLLVVALVASGARARRRSARRKLEV